MICPACAEYPLAVHKPTEPILFIEGVPVAWICEVHGILDSRDE